MKLPGVIVEIKTVKYFQMMIVGRQFTFLFLNIIHYLVSCFGNTETNVARHLHIGKDCSTHVRELRPVDSLLYFRYICNCQKPQHMKIGSFIVNAMESTNAIFLQTQWQSFFFIIVLKSICFFVLFH